MTRIRRILTALATLAGALLAFTAAAPAALAIRVPPPGGTAGPVQAPPQVPHHRRRRHARLGDRPDRGRAALATAAVAILVDRAWAARKAHTTTA